jgi:FxsC-like protein
VGQTGTSASPSPPPDQDSTPPGRDRDYYGPQPEDWRPYHPDSTVPLARRPEDVARGLGYTPIVSALTRYSPELQPVPAVPAAGAVPDGPGVLLVDPWIAHTINSGTVAQVDRCRKEWIRVLVPWSCSDRQTTEQATALRSLLEGVMPWSMQEWRRTAPAATRDLASVTERAGDAADSQESRGLVAQGGLGGGGPGSEPGHV